ncbi:MAG: hypothetical protein KIH00_00840 [Lachnospiraceae bacterium]|nr:hypothetical protein [Lachnospiraceae bacterium]
MKKRKAAIFLIGMVMTLSLAGCSKKTSAGPEKELQTTQEQTEKDEETGQDSHSENADEAVSEESEIRFTVVQNHIETEDYYVPEEGDSFPYAFVEYSSFELPDDLKKNYPTLAQSLEEYSTDTYEYAVSTLARAAESAREEDMSYFATSYQESWDLEVLRADERAVGWLVVYYYYYGGPHPYTYFGTDMIDTKTGKTLTLSDVVKDVDGLSQIILENLIAIDDTYVFSEEENAQMLPLIEDMIDGGYLPWILNDTGFHVYFDAYALQYYAFGPIFADLSYEEYPDLFNEDYLPVKEDIPVEERISYKEAEPAGWSSQELEPYLGEWETQGAGDQAGYFVIECPDWEVPYIADGIFDTLTASPVKLSEVSKDSSICLFEEDWSAETGIPLPGDLYGEGYSDDAYYYYADNSADEGRLAVEISEMGTYDFVGTYDFSNYLYTPTPGNAYTTLYIPYAAIYDGVLYTEIAHLTYSEDQPCTGFVVAVEVETGKLLWRSEMLLANGRNFLVGEDTIICGYGFTDEDDYLFILSRHSGAVLEKRKLKTGPDYFIPVDDSLYVLTYDTVYQYLVSEN